MFDFNVHNYAYGISMLWYNYRQLSLWSSILDIVLPLLKKGDYIEGSFVKSAHCNGFINDGNPGDRADKIGRFPFSIHNAKEAVQFANAAQINWQERGFESRLQSVHSYIGQLESRLPYLTNVLTREVGLPTWEARQEVLDTKKYIEQLISAAAQMYNSQNLEQIDHDPMALQYNQPIYCPLGTLAVLTPFSLALQTPSVYTCAALLTGNTVVHKPSKYTPGVGQAVAELWDRCQLPRGVYNMIQGPGSHIGHYLIGNKSIDGTLFAGSHSTVQDISSKLELPPHYPLICQLGGKSSAIVLEDADLESTARALLAGAYRMTGQRPTSIARVFVSSVIANVLIDVLAKSIDQIEVGYGEDSTAYLGPMISDHWRTRFHRYGHTLLMRQLLVRVRYSHRLLMKQLLMRVRYGHQLLMKQLSGVL